MDINQIKELQQKAEKEFNDLKDEGDKLRSRVQEIETRLTELRGEYQAYTKLTPDPATTVKAEKKTKNG